jgi:gliding motility-associated-like protein
MKQKIKGRLENAIFWMVFSFFGLIVFDGNATNCPGVTLTFTSSSVNPTCNTPDGTIGIQGVTGGSGNYTFALNGGAAQTPVNPPFNNFSFPNLLSGSYFITISDGTCDTTITITLGSSIGGIDSASATVVNTSCISNTGSITVQAFPAGVAVQQYGLSTGVINASGFFDLLGSGNYSVTLLDANNCTFIINGIVVATPPAPTSMDLTVTQPPCQGATGSVEINSIAGGTGPYKVSLNGSSFQNKFLWEGLTPGSYLVTVKDNNGCVFSQTVNIVSGGVVSRDCNAGKDVTINFGDNYVMEAVQGSGNTVDWSPGFYLSDTTTINPTAFPPATTVFTLTTTTPEGCICTDKVTVTVVPLIDAPNTFTPNEDGVNDVWVIRNTGFYEGVNLYIYNRYGDRIYEAKEFGPGLEWDGKFKGNYVPSATYYYVLNFRFVGEETIFTYTGSITVIK